MNKYFNSKKPNPHVNQYKRENQAISSAFKVFLLLGLQVLYTEHGFDGDMLEQFIDDIHGVMDDYNSGTITVEDMNAAIKAETGIDILNTQDMIFK